MSSQAEKSIVSGKETYWKLTVHEKVNEHVVYM